MKTNHHSAPLPLNSLKPSPPKKTPHKDIRFGVAGKVELRLVSYTLTCFFAVPMVVLLTLVANLSEVKVSLMWAIIGDTMTNMRHLLLPPSEYCKR